MGFLLKDITQEQAFQVVLVVKNPPVNTGDIKRRRFDLWVRKIPWKRKWQPTPVFLPEKFCGQRSLVGYSSLGHRELDTTEHTHTPLKPQACQGLPYTFQMLSSS